MPEVSDRRGKPTPSAFAAACLLMAANVALYLKVDRKSFLRNAALAYDHIARKSQARKGRTVEDYAANSGDSGNG